MKLTKHNRRIRKAKRSLGLWACTSGLCVSLLVVSQADDAYADFTRRGYVGLGAGVTQLEPKTPNSSLSVSDDTDAGFHVVGGYDFTSRFSAEFYYADLGAAEIAFLGSDVGGINYQVVGLSGIAYIFNSRSGFSANPNTSGIGTREGFSLFGRAGIGAVSADSELDYKVDHAAHLALGLGAEYGFKNGFAVRGEYRALDTDQQYASLSLIKRFGKVSRPLVAVAPGAASIATPAAATSADTTPTTNNFDIPSIFFAFDQSVISPGAASKLNEIADILSKSDATIALDGHSDWIASESYNLALSTRRAENARLYLESKGIDRSRITVRGFGETRPAATNETAEGRAKNRRVDIRIN